MFTLWPAIDLRRRQVVRLEQGRDDAATQYSSDPVAVAEAFVADGASAVHVVDLDAAFGDGSNLDVIRQIVARLAGRARLQVGGGVRNDEVAAGLLDAGVDRVVVGSAAVEEPALVERLVGRWGAERIIVGLDARDREVRLRGWVGGSGRDVCEVARELAALGASETVSTNIARDGMLGGPDLALSLEVAQAGLRVVVSGGVGTLDDIRAARRGADRGFSGVIVGRALYERRFALHDAVAAAGAREVDDAQG